MYKNIDSIHKITALFAKKTNPQTFINSTIDKQVVAICNQVVDYTSIKMNKLLVHIASWMNLKNIMQVTEMTQKSK